MPCGRILDALGARVIPFVRGEKGCTAAPDERRNQKHVVVFVHTTERSIGVCADTVLEEPGSDIGISVCGETVATGKQHFISACVGIVVAGCEGVRDSVLVRNGIRRLPPPRANVEWVFGAAGCKDRRWIF